jgi:signal transduction histidine kinase/ActR/RegA family two-component response regulator
MNDFDTIQKKIQILETHLQHTSVAVEKVDVMNELAGELFVYDVERAQEYARQSRKIAQKENYQKGIADSLNKEALCCRIRSDFKRSIQFAREALAIFKKLENPAGQAESLNNIAFMEVNMEDYKNALHNCLQATILAQEAGNKDLEAFSTLVAGMVYEGFGDYSVALEHHIKTLALCRITGNKANEGAALINLGIVFRKIGQREKAREHFEGAYKIFKGLKIKLLEAASLYNLGTSYRDFGDYPKALETFTSSLVLQKEIGHVQGQGACYINIGFVMTKLRKFAEAEENIRESIELARAFGRKNYECNGMLNMGECLLEQHREREAVTILEEARGESEVYGAKDVRSKILIALSRAYEMKGDFRKAFSFFKESTAIRDELINEESTRKNNALMILHEVETVKREREEALREKDRAEQSEKFKEQFLANMSHEIRTPMNAIVGLVDLLSRTKMIPLQTRYLSAIRQSADNLLGIIQDILDFSKIESGQLELEEINFSIHEALEAVYETLRYKAEEKNISIAYQRNSDIPELVCGDPIRLRQILINLIGNAIKFTEHGVVTMEAQVVEQSKEKVHLRFSVSDTGIGIPQNKLEDVFKSFVQASSSTTRKYGGTGLGLSISKYLVEMQHGTISVQSKLGKGTEFTFDLPYKTAVETNNANEKEKTGDEPSAEIKALEGIRVLVVEDNRFNQMVAVDSLQSSIPSVFIELVENGKLAIQKLEGSSFDLVLLDLQMPEMDGYETTAYIRNEMQPPQKMIPIIALTANATKTEKEKCLKAGMNGYLSKPFRIDDLIAQIHTVIISHSLS